jgi:tRNA(fMet)-specific endonuclease VapC
MSYLFDSDRTIDYLDGRAEARGVFSRLAPLGVSISIVTYIEVYEGSLSATNPIDARQRLAEFMALVPVLLLSEQIARRCARVRHDLRLRRRRVRSRALDLIIASTALEHDLTLVTRNRADYSDIPGLLLYSDG